MCVTRRPCRKIDHRKRFSVTEIVVCSLQIGFFGKLLANLLIDDLVLFVQLDTVIGANFTVAPTGGSFALRLRRFLDFLQAATCDDLRACIDHLRTPCRGGEARFERLQVRPDLGLGERLVFLDAFKVLQKFLLECFMATCAVVRFHDVSDGILLRVVLFSVQAAAFKVVSVALRPTFLNQIVELSASCLAPRARLITLRWSSRHLPNRRTASVIFCVIRLELFESCVGIGGWGGVARLRDLANLAAGSHMFRQVVLQLVRVLDLLKVRAHTRQSLAFSGFFSTSVLSDDPH